MKCYFDISKTLYLYLDIQKGAFQNTLYFVLKSHKYWKTKWMQIIIWIIGCIKTIIYYDKYRQNVKMNVFELYKIIVFRIFVLISHIINFTLYIYIFGK